MSIIPSPVRCTRVANVDEGLLLSGPVSVSFSGEGADAVAGYLCSYFSESLELDSLVESQVAAANTEGIGPACALSPISEQIAHYCICSISLQNLNYCQALVSLYCARHVYA